MRKMFLVPVGIVILGILMLFAGSAVASAEEGVSTAIGKFLQNKWVAIGLVLTGILWFAHDEGFLGKLT